MYIIHIIHILCKAQHKNQAILIHHSHFFEATNDKALDAAILAAHMGTRTMSHGEPRDGHRLEDSGKFGCPEADVGDGM